MKKLVIMILFAMMSMNIIASTTKTVNDTVEVKKEAVIDFKADIDLMTPMGYAARSGLTDAFIQMGDGKVWVNLPYIGEVYAPSMNHDGMHFKESYSNMKMTETKKKDARDITFTVFHDNLKYDFYIILYDNNTIYVQIQPSNASVCNYSGTIRTW